MIKVVWCTKWAEWGQVLSLGRPHKKGEQDMLFDSQRSQSGSYQLNRSWTMLIQVQIFQRMWSLWRSKEWLIVSNAADRSELIQKQHHYREQITYLWLLWWEKHLTEDAKQWKIRGMTYSVPLGILSFFLKFGKLMSVMEEGQQLPDEKKSKSNKHNTTNNATYNGQHIDGLWTHWKKKQPSVLINRSITQ